MKRISHIAVIILAILPFTACDSSDSSLDKNSSISGVYVMNQGGTVCFYDDAKDTLSLDIYQDVNGAPLGDRLSAMSFRKDKGYLIVEKAGEQVIEVIDPTSFTSKSSITGLSDLTDVAAVSNLFIYTAKGVEGAENSGEVLALDAETHETLATIKVGKYPTRLAYSQGKKLYVANSGGGIYSDSTVMEIDITTNEVVDTIYLEQQIDDSNVLKLKSPVEMIIDANQNVWVLCKGISSEGGAILNAGLAKVTYGTNIVTVFPFKNGYVGNGRNCLARSSSGVYVCYVNNGTYSMSVNATELSTKKLFKDRYADIVFDAIKINPKTGEYYCSLDVDGGVSNDSVYIFDRYGLNIKKKNIVVGSMPRDFVFYP